MIIQVTKEDINNGQQCSAFNCPVSNAIRRTLDLPKNTVSVVISCAKIYHSPPDYALGYTEPMKVIQLPHHVGTAACRFDDTGEMQPFRFDLSI